MTTEHPTLLLADINAAAAALSSSGKPHLAMAVLQLRDLAMQLHQSLEAERAAHKQGEPM